MQIQRLNLDQAIDVFIEGFCFAKSFTHPYVSETVGRMRAMRDAPRRSGSYRTEEFVVHGISAAEAVRTIMESHPKRFAVSVIHELGGDGGAVKRDYKEQGLRYRGSEPLFVCSTTPSNPLVDSLPIRRVTTAKDAERVRLAADLKRQILPHHLIADAPLRLYAAFNGDEAVGWVRSITASHQATWVSNMYVLPAYRRRGIGSALMTAMLQEDRKLGVQHSVLLASNAGSKLYPLVGYEQIGILQLFVPGSELRQRASGA